MHGPVCSLTFNFVEVASVTTILQRKKQEVHTMRGLATSSLHLNVTLVKDIYTVDW